jgi:hypothetical protein
VVRRAVKRGGVVVKGWLETPAVWRMKNTPTFADFLNFFATMIRVKPL